MKRSIKHTLLKKIENIVLRKYNRRITKKPENRVVEFYLMDSFEIFHFLPIYKSLINEGINARFVCEPVDINTVKKWFDYDNAINILKELKVNYTQKANPYARVAFTTQQASILRKYYGIKINLNYGCGFNKTNFGNTSATTKGFDFKFVHGKYMARIAKKFMKPWQVKIVGYPKHDDYFKEMPSKNEIKNNLGIKTDKPILVYFPTWDEDSSIMKFAQDIAKLKDKFYIVTKAHHCTFRLKEKKAELDLLYDISDRVLEGNSKFSDAVVIADIALIDAKSGSSCEVPYLNSSLPIVYLSPRENLYDFFKDDIFSFGEFINKPEQIKQVVYKTFEQDKYVTIRQKKICYYLGPRDSKSTLRALNILKKVLK